MTQTLENNLDQFLNHLKVERGLSAHTITSYQTDLLQAIRFFKDSGITHLKEVSEAHIRELLVHGRSQQKTSRSLNRQLSSLRTFFQYWLREKLIPENKALQVNSLKMPKLLPKPLDVDEMSKLLEIKPHDFFSCRDLAIMELIYSAGLRVSELCNLTLEDIDLSQHQIRVLGKGKKTRIGIMGRLAAEALQAWLKERSIFSTNEDSALFINKRGQKLGVRQIQMIIKRRGLLQGIEQNVHPHRLRHSFASHLLESSGDLRAVQELLGHRSLSSTEIYTQLNFQHLANTYDQCHPKARLAQSSTKEGKIKVTSVQNKLEENS